MKEKIVFFGVGGKMGVCLVKNLKKFDYCVVYVEVSVVGQQCLCDEVGVECVSIDVVLDNVDVVILVVFDILIGRIVVEILFKLCVGVMVMILDVVVFFVGYLLDWLDLVYFVVYFCYLFIFNDEIMVEGWCDFFGGGVVW